MSRTRAALLFAPLLALAGLPTAGAQAPKSGRKVALLVAVQDYADTGLSNLKYCENDIDELAAVLKAQGYRADDVVVLTDAAAAQKGKLKYMPTAAHVRRELKGLIEDLRSEDTFLVAFSGHGVHLKALKEKGLHFCAKGCNLDKPETMVSLGEVYEQLEKHCKAELKLMFVDACRNDPADGKGGPDARMQSETMPLIPDPPGGIVAFYSCSTGQKSYESDTLKHGIFFHHVIQGLKGGPADDPIAKKGEVTVPLLEDYLTRAVPTAVKKDKDDRTLRQIPERVGKLRGSGVLASVSGSTAVAPPVKETAAIPSPATTVETKPEWAYAHDLKVRKGGFREWDSAKRIGIETFRHSDSGAIVAITEAGQLAVLPAAELDADKEAKWFNAVDLRARGVGETEFTAKTVKVGVELYKDTASGKLLHLSESAGISFLLAGPPAPDAAPVWRHAVALKVRGAKEEEFTERTKRVFVEVYDNKAAGCLVYVSKAGMISTAPAARAAAADPAKPPAHLYGLLLRVRTADEESFTADTRQVGIEVYRDENTGGLVYASESGAFCCVPAPATIREKRGVEWKFAMKLKARPGGETSFAKANGYGVEVFEDRNTGYFVFLSDAGGLAVLPRK